MSVDFVQDARVLTCTPSQAVPIPSLFILGVCAGSSSVEPVDVDLDPSSQSTGLVLSSTQRDAQETNAVKPRGIATLNASSWLAMDWKEVSARYAESVKVPRVSEKIPFLSDDDICNDRAIKAKGYY